MERNENQLYLQVAQSLRGCQLVEEKLKLYISQALLLARKCIGQRLPFRLSGDDYQNCSLGRLISTFERLSSNPALVKRLHAFREERNFLSHQAIAICLDFDGRVVESSAADLKPRLLAIEKEADELVRAVHEEEIKFTPTLDFGDFLDEAASNT